MKVVLFVAYFFPPQGGGGVQRTVKFVKYLPQFGWRPTILTTSAAPSLPDPSLQADIPDSTPVARVRGLGLPHHLPWRVRRWLSTWLLIVDEYVGWLPFAVRRGLHLLRDSAFQAIYSTASPHTDHLVALRLKRASSLPWIADFRDPWLDNELARHPTPLHRAIVARLERQVVETADRVLVVSEPMRRNLLARHPHLPAGRVLTLPNGFDPADFEGVQAAPRDDRFTLVYTGSLYGFVSARSLLAALRQLLDRGVLSRSTIVLRFVGNTGKEIVHLIKEWNLADVVELVGYVPHGAVPAYQLSADVLLLIVGAGRATDVVYTGKVFEYLAAGRPILAMVPPGAAASLLAEAGNSWLVAPDDIDQIAASLTTLYSDWQHGRLRSSRDPAVVARYNRQLQTGILAHILDEIAGQCRRAEHRLSGTAGGSP